LNCFYGYPSGFNGKENDNEIKGVGNQQDYGMRNYDPRLGKFLSVDPLTKDYPWYTPYQFAGNKPIWASDLDGLEEFFETNYYDQKGNLYKTVITLASDRGIKDGNYTVHKSSVYTNLSSDAAGNLNTSFVKFYDGSFMSPCTSPASFSNPENYTSAMGRNQNGTIQWTQLVPGTNIINGGAITPVNQIGKTPGTLSIKGGDMRSPEARYSSTFTTTANPLLILQSPQFDKSKNDIVLDQVTNPAIYNGVTPLGENLPLGTNAVPKEAFKNTDIVKAQEGDGDEIH